jgi:hypothetical protein
MRQEYRPFYLNLSAAEIQEVRVVKQADNENTLSGYTQTIRMPTLDNLNEMIDSFPDYGNHDVQFNTANNN